MKTADKTAANNIAGWWYFYIFNNTSLRMILSLDIETVLIIFDTTSYNGPNYFWYHLVHKLCFVFGDDTLDSRTVKVVPPTVTSVSTIFSWACSLERQKSGGYHSEISLERLRERERHRAGTANIKIKNLGVQWLIEGGNINWTININTAPRSLADSMWCSTKKPFGFGFASKSKCRGCEGLKWSHWWP